MDDEILEEIPVQLHYITEEGDTWEAIAKDFNTTKDQIAQANPNLDLTQVIPGQDVRIPFLLRFCTNGTLYITRRGDTLAQITRQFGVTEAELRRANPLINFINLRPGLLICIPRPRPVPCPGGTVYTVQRGDTLRNLADRFNVTVREILAANLGLERDDLDPGMRICIPRPRPMPCPGRIYVVRAGDTAFAIASRFNVTLAQLQAANPGVNLNIIFPGQELCIPR